MVSLPGGVAAGPGDGRRGRGPSFRKMENHVGRTSLCALVALVAATVLGGCGGSDAEQIPEAPALAAAAQANVDFCSTVQPNIDAGNALTEFAAAGTPPRSADELRGVLEPLRASNAAMVAAAPEVMKADMQQTAEATEMKLAAFEASGGDPVAATADPAVAEKLKAAAEPNARIRQYIRTVCRIAPN
jgi:hypothetical protein